MRTSQIGLVLCLAAAATTLTACSVSVGGSNEIDRSKAEKFLRTNIHPTPKSVTCPSGVKEKKGGTFNCTVVTPGGRTATVTIHMTDSSGGVHVSNADIHFRS